MTLGSRRYQLQQLLESFEPNASETRARNEMLLLIGIPSDPFSRYHYDPGHFTGSACVVSPDATDVLLIHHTRLDRWLQPGGHVDPEDASVPDAAMREAVEETGVALTSSSPILFDIDVHHVPAGKGEPPHDHFDLRFLLQAERRDVTPAVAEVNEVRWVRFDEVADLSDEVSLRRMVAKARERYR